MTMPFAAAILAFAGASLAAAASLEIAPTAAALAGAMRGHGIVLLGEVHDNAAQHALRLEALQRSIAGGARPAVALEQFDRERQPDIDRARRERPGDADYLIAQARGGAGWQWSFYRPYVALALQFDLPIVAANLSRGDALRVAVEGWPAVFDATTIRRYGLDALPEGLLGQHVRAIALGHCNLLSADESQSLARAQIARDLMMARTIDPYLHRGVVLLAGNGHVRRDIGVRFWLPADAAGEVISIGLLETGEGAATESGADFDAFAVTARADRPDPCADLAKRRRANPAR